MAEALEPGIVAEMREHLAAIEPLLLAAEHRTLAAAEIADLFRAIHSLKGLARVAEALSMERLLHGAESHLAGVRSGERPLATTAVDALIGLVDWIGAAIEAGPLAEAEAPEAIADAVGALDGGPGGRAQGEAAPSRLVLGLEPDMVRAFAELLAEVRPSLEAWAGASVAGADDSGRDDADMLVHAAAKLGLAGLAAAALRLRDAVRGARPAAFAALAGLMEAFEIATGVAVGARDATALPVPAPPTEGPLEDLRLAFTQAGVAPVHVPRVLTRATERLLEGTGAGLVEIAFEAPDAGLIGAIADWPILASRAAEIDGSAVLALLIAAPGGRAPPFADGSEAKPAHVQVLDGRTPPRLFGAPVEAAPVADETQVRVPVGVLDKLFGRIGSFFSVGGRLNALMNESRADDALRRLADHVVARAPTLMPDVEALVRDRADLRSIEAEIGHLISLIHESTLGLRVIPFETVVGRFPRMVRDTARGLGKEVRFELAADRGIKIDKGMADALTDPMMHMIRNAIDHGIETPEARIAAGKPPVARLTLRAEQAGNRLVLAIADDGRGIDVERVGRKAVAQRLVMADELERMSPAQVARFIFTPGLSTRDQASDVSGRGVGMDVVLVNVTRLGGRIDIDTVAGRGTTFRLDLPLSAAIRPMLLADTGVQLIGFPESMVSETVMVPRGELQSVNGQPSLLHHGRFLPVFELCPLLGLPMPAHAPPAEIAIVVCRWNGHRAGFSVDRIRRRVELLIRETHLRVTDLPGMGGVSILGADRIVLALDPDKLMALAVSAATRGLRSAPKSVAPVAAIETAADTGGATP